MPLADKSLSRDRVEFYECISEEEINSIIGNKDARVLQTSNPVDQHSWVLINELLLSKRPDMEIRVYGHYSKNCDLSFIKSITNVRNLSIDCLSEASNIAMLGQLKHLEALSVGIYSLEDFEFLHAIPVSIKKLFIGATKSKKPKLLGLSRFSKLEELYIEGQQKGIEVIGELQSIRKLVLRSVTPKDISFLRKLKNLWYLDIKLGGINDLTPIAGLSNLKYLELWQIKGLSGISVISTLTGLQYLFLQSLRNVSTLPDMADLHNLRRIHLETMKGLTDISGLMNAAALEEFIHVCAQNMSPEQYHELLGLNTLKMALFGFGSDVKNNKISELMEAKGIEQYRYEPFEFK